LRENQIDMKIYEGKMSLDPLWVDSSITKKNVNKKMKSNGTCSRMNF
jgi:hypothetical protein